MASTFLQRSTSPRINLSESRKLLIVKHSLIARLDWQEELEDESGLIYGLAVLEAACKRQMSTNKRYFMELEDSSY